MLTELKFNLKIWSRVLRTRSPRMAYVCGWLGQRNLGDEALFAAMQRLFGGHALLSIPKHGDLPWAPPGVPAPIREAVLAGGTMINGPDAWRHLCDRVFDRCSRNLVFGSGVQDPVMWGEGSASRDTRREWAETLRRCEFVGVRGPHSAALLAEAGFESAEVVGDPVLVYAPDHLDRPAAPVGGRVGLNIGQSGGNLWGDEARIVAEAAALAERLRTSGREVHWYVVWPQDLAVTLEAAERSGTADFVHEHYDDHLAYMEEMRTLDAFAGVKLHAVVLAVCALVPSVMLEYRPKCRDFMMSLGLERLNVRTDEFEGAAVADLLADLSDRREEEVRVLEEALRPLCAAQAARAAALAAGSR